MSRSIWSGIMPKPVRGYQKWLMMVAGGADPGEIARFTAALRLCRLMRWAAQPAEGSVQEIPQTFSVYGSK